MFCYGTKGVRRTNYPTKLAEKGPTNIRVERSQTKSEKKKSNVTTKIFVKKMKPMSLKWIYERRLRQNNK